MIEIIDIDKNEQWDTIVRSFLEYDVYYLSGYIKAFQLHGDGLPQLLYYKTEKLKAIYVFMKRKTAIADYFDSVTPYGYGGILFEGDLSDENLQLFWRTYIKKMMDEGIVDNFVRYHPILANAIPMKKISTVIDLGKTIAIDLSSEDIIWNNITSKNRNMIRKAEKNGVEIRHGRNLQLFRDFQRIYNDTMEKDHAEEYYFFEEAFYQSIHHDLYDNYEMFYAIKDGTPISMSIIIYANHQMHYHLSGSLPEFRHLAPSNLLLYQAALWGCERGLKTFHLGGGVGNEEDNLYKFKAAFNRNSNYQFSIGKEVFNNQKYDDLIEERSLRDDSFNMKSSFFPLYRSEH